MHAHYSWPITFRRHLPYPYVVKMVVVGGEYEVNVMLQDPGLEFHI